MGKHSECSQPNGQHRGARQDSGKSLTGNSFILPVSLVVFENQNWNFCFILFVYVMYLLTERKANWGILAVASIYAF